MRRRIPATKATKMSDQPELQRLQKVMAAAGVASRRASENLINEGRVTVDGEVAHIGMKVDAGSVDIRVDGERINADPDKVYIILNKPQGVVTTADDPEGRPTVMDLINLPMRLYPVGRLDMDTEGLLLLTNDGELTHQLLHPSFEVPRTYVALVPGPVRRGLQQELRDGVELDDGHARARSVRVVEEQHGKVLLELIMTEGRKREVRRMLDAVGLNCERLARINYGGVEMGELRQGKWRFLTQREVGLLFEAVGSGPVERDAKNKRRASRKATSTDERRRRGQQR